MHMIIIPMNIKLILVKIFIALGFHGYQKNNNCITYLWFLHIFSGYKINIMHVLIGKYYERTQ